MPKVANPVWDFMTLCEHTEISKLFAAWTGLAMVGATMGRATWLDMGTFAVYPNLYVVLVAASGSFRKSTVINLAESLMVVDPPLNFISTSLTPEALFRSMVRAEREVTVEGGVKEWRTEGVVIADELATFLNKNSYERGIAPYLIRFFDCKKQVEYETLKRGKEVARNVCMSMLAGSTADLLRDAVPVDAVGSGLTSRMLFIFTDQLPPPVARPITTPEDAQRRQDIVSALQCIRNLSGPATLLPETWELYEKEYVEHRKSPFMASPVLSGYASRWHYHALAISMILSASDDPLQERLVVQPRHFIHATKLLAAAEVHMPKVMTLITATERGAQVELLSMYIHLVPEGVRKDMLLRSVSHRISLREFEEAISTLVASGRIVRGGPDGATYIPTRK